LGKYQIRRAIGKGAMGVVYEGFDPIIDRVVAIKTIKKDGLDPEEAEEHSRRFLIEAKAAGRLNHKNIVGIYDYGEEKGLSFIVMEFVQGKELKSFFAARHPFSMSQIVRLMSELLDALGYSHSRGVIHRDVKPDNIFVTDDGSVKLGDFGIARIDSTSKTHAGTVLGTPSYMAPEQIRGETADARSDLYAAGIILYQFLVGERPFSGGMVAVMQKVLMEAPKPPSSHNPSIPAAIDIIVLMEGAREGGRRPFRQRGRVQPRAEGGGRPVRRRRRIRFDDDHVGPRIEGAAGRRAAGRRPYRHRQHAGRHGQRFDRFQRLRRPAARRPAAPSMRGPT
jgi:serine/threonine protein kinase